MPLIKNAIFLIEARDQFEFKHLSRHD